MILTNARLVLPDQVIHGTIVSDDERITDVQPGLSHSPGAIDMDGDTIIPGIIDLHTDNLERQVQPRNNARWPSRSAMLTHDAQCAASGVTTVFDALCLGDLGFDKGREQTFLDGVIDLDALADTGLLKSEHHLHLRCELPAGNLMALFEPVAEHPRVRMVSLMDHSPGMGQYANLDRYRAMRAKDGHTAEWIEQRIIELQGQRALHRDRNRQALLARIQGRTPGHAQGPALALASHDDRTAEEIAENHRDGIGISEFPVSLLAANAARAHGMQVIAGAPNIVRGGSHSGNVSAAELMRRGTVDGLASDYVPASLVEAAFASVKEAGITLPEGVAMVTANPARMAGLTDRGRLQPGLRADLVRLREHEGLAVVRQVWRTGERVI